MGLPLPVFDFHAHLPYTGEDLWGSWAKNFSARFGKEKLKVWDLKNKEAQKKWWLTYSFPFPDEPQPSPAECVQRYEEEIIRYGLLGICFVTGGGNETLGRLLKPFPRLYGFAHHDPYSPEAPQELKRAVQELGMVGYKILAPALEKKIDHPDLDPLWETCAELKIPVLIHFGPLGGEAGITYTENINPLVLHDVAKGFPSIPFVVPHFGCGYLRELLHLMWACDNVYVDTSGNNEWRRYIWPEPTLKELFRLFYELFGAKRIIFGTDSSHFPRGWVYKYFEEQFRAAVEAGIPDEGLKDIFAQNALRLLKINL
ncbi:hypothetical protein SAMN00808754_1831 [Thermanaeromonas toyohensis ToBE]|uniref:Amidohydrolase-related domain-containing protein n=1 Tax=Thermanaeromonas toyohensis ToBE TaxID=698762 RepID=A0A1W1VW74_9FIRM|nr:amidohydrolase family protein [Thermanaeromonas toyohensis]SMB97361.1 hypothetical protein SAMN00808754_1831 [Thermanaeromonas toyohensis ToBE]